MKLKSLLSGLIIGLIICSSNGFAEADKWTQKADMPTERGYFATSEVDGKIYAIGGMKNENSIGVVLQTTEEYDPILDKWVRKDEMPTERAYLSTAVLNGKIYAIGGVRFGLTPLSKVEEYDPKKDLWTKKDDIIIPRFCFASAVVEDRIYVIGGATAHRVEGNFGIIESTSSVEEYDPVTNRWTEKADMPTARYDFAVGVVKDKIYCIGGRDGGKAIDDILSIVEEYDPSLDKWTQKADMPTPRFFMSASVANDKIYVIGGHSGLSIVEEYDPETDKWTRKADMMIGRGGNSSCSVNGKIYAIGGYNHSGYLSTVEEYDTGFGAKNVDAKGKLATNWGEIKSNG